MTKLIFKLQDGSEVSGTYSDSEADARLFHALIHTDDVVDYKKARVK